MYRSLVAEYTSLLEEYMLVAEYTSSVEEYMLAVGYSPFVEEYTSSEGVYTCFLEAEMPLKKCMFLVEV